MSPPLQPPYTQSLDGSPGSLLKNFLPGTQAVESLNQAYCTTETVSSQLLNAHLASGRDVGQNSEDRLGNVFVSQSKGLLRDFRVLANFMGFPRKRMGFPSRELEGFA